MWADRFGSYSIEATFAGISCLSRLKSIVRERFLCPPTRHPGVRWPRLPRPPVLSLPFVSDFSGPVFVISEKSDVVRWRRLGDVGLYDLTGMARYTPSKRAGSFWPFASFT